MREGDALQEGSAPRVPRRGPEVVVHRRADHEADGAPAGHDLLQPILPPSSFCDYLTRQLIRTQELIQSNSR